MATSPDPCLTKSDLLVWKNLQRDVETSRGAAQTRFPDSTDEATKQTLSDLNNPKADAFEPTVCTIWDQADISPVLSYYLIRPYTEWARTVVRRPTDVVFLTHIILYLGTLLPSAIGLFVRFNWTHAIFHWVLAGYYCGAFTLMLHNHIHNNGVLAPQYSTFDRLWPYILEPLMGHTWDSYYYHHVKHHHVENNGPGDLSSTIRYQRDELFDFACYVGRFLFFIWIELPLYFYRKGKQNLAIRSGLTELTSYFFIYAMARYNLHATIFVLVIPLVQMRIGMMVGNWGQHALVDEVEPDSDFRSSITLIDVPSNRHCFNDGYHTSHHLNPKRHWRDHPHAFLQGKDRYKEGRALVFEKIDFLGITYHLMKKNYSHLASCLIPIGDQTKLSLAEIEEMLKTKTRRFSEDDIVRHWGKLR